MFRAVVLLAAVWQAPVEVASGPAHRGAWAMNESDYRWVDDPTVALDANGDAAVAWVDQATKDVFFQRYSEKNQPLLAKPVNVSRSPKTFTWLPRVAIAGQEVSLLWQEIVFSGGTHGGEIFFARSSDGGRTFGAPQNLSNSKAGDGKGRLSEKLWDNGSLELVRAGSALYAAWTEYEGTLWLRRSSGDGKTFGAAVAVSSSARAPALAVFGEVVHLAWSVEGESIKLATSRDGGRTFAAPRTLGRGDAPKLAVDSKGTLHLAYGTRTAVFYQRVRDEKVEQARQLDTAKVAARFPALRVDASDRVYVLWEEYLALDEHPRGLGFVSSLDAGAHFGPPTLLAQIAGAKLGYNGSQQGLLTSKLAVNAGGAIAVVNSTFRPGDGSNVWLLRGRL